MKTKLPLSIRSFEELLLLFDYDRELPLNVEESGVERKDGVSIKPELERVDMLSEKLTSVDVRWPSYDASGKEKASERSHYILQLGKDEQMHIRLVLTRTR